MESILSLNLDELKSWMVAHEEPAYRAAQVFEWIYKRRVSSWDAMTNLSKSLRETLQQNFSLAALTLKRVQESADGETTKYLWQLSDKKLVESVLIRAPDRRTVCVSSQVGCPVRCAFCASGKNGFFKNLSGAEIVDQVLQIQRELDRVGESVTNIVFMGMGEPMLNLDSVLGAISGLTDPERLGLSQRRITVSTVGVTEGIERMIEADLRVSLVLSLHAPNERVRRKIIPYARKYSLEDLIDAMDRYALQTKRDITYEYILIEGINDQPEHARELAYLVGGKQCTVNLIPYNPVAGLKLNRPSTEAVEIFRQILTNMRVVNTCRYTKGDDIAAACGQLALISAEN